MRRNASTVVVLPGPVPAEVLAALGQSMNVALIRPDDTAGDNGDEVETAAGALWRAGRSTSPYALVAADPLAAVAAGWQAMWDVSRPQGPASFELEAAKVLGAWRSGRFELPDYYLILAPSGPMGSSGPLATLGPSGPGPGGLRPVGPGPGGPRPVGPGSGVPEAGDQGPDFYLGPLRSVRPRRVAFVAATEPAQQAAGVLAALGSLRHGPWWPGLDEVIETARAFYPGRLAGESAG